MRINRKTVRKATAALLVGGALIGGMPVIEHASAATAPTFDRILVDASAAAMYPSGLEYDPYLDRLVVADTAGDTIQIYELDGTRVTTFSSYGTAPGQVASPRDIAIDEQSNIYVADAENNRVQKFDADGAFQWSTTGEVGTCQQCLNTPIGVTWDADNDVVLVASSGNNFVKAFDADGTFVWQQNTNANGSPMATRGPRDITRGPDGRIWISNYLGHQVKAFDVSPTGGFTLAPVITLGDGLAAGKGVGQLNFPYNVVFSADGTIVYVSDTGNGRVARWDISGPEPVWLEPFGGRCTNHPQYCADPPADAGKFNHLRRVAIDGAGNIYAADFWGNGIEVFDPAGNWIRSIEGATAPLPGVSEAYGVAVGGPDGQIYVMDRNNHRIQRFSAEGTFLNAAGARGTQPGVFSWPEAVAVAPDGSVWSADTRGDRISRWPADLATTPNIRSWGDSANTNASGPGRFTYIEDLDVAPDGRVWVADTRNDRLQIFDPTTETFTLFGGPGTGQGEFNDPMGVAVNTAAVYVADTLNNRIQKLGLDGLQQAVYADSLTGPEGVAVAPDGTVWVADTGAHRILHLSADLVLLESFGSFGTGDGQFTKPHTLAATATELFVADTYNNRVQVFALDAPTGPDTIAPAGAVTSPTPNAVVTDPTTITGTATDNVGVATVEVAVKQGNVGDGPTNLWLKADGTWGSSFQYVPVTVASPGATTTEWSFPLDVPALGTYGLMARATDAAGNVTVFRTYTSFRVGAAPDGVAPTGTLTSPTPGGTVPEGSPITGTAADNVGVAAVDVAVQLGGTTSWLTPEGTFAPGFRFVPATVDSAGATSTAWSLPFDAPAGSYAVMARARDLAGNITPFRSYMPFTVGAGTPPDTTNPTGQVTTPTPGATLTDPGTIVGTASDDVAVATVDVAVRNAAAEWLRPDGSWLSGFAWVPATVADPGSKDTAWSFLLDVPADGTYNLMARATDTSGNFAPIRSYMTFTVAGTPEPGLDPQPQGEISAAGGVAPLYPAGGVTGPDGTRYIADSGGSRLVAMDAAGVVSTLGAATWNDPRDIDLDPADGTLWVANTSASEVVHITTAGVVIDRFGGSAQYTTPYGIAVDADALYVADTYDNRGNNEFGRIVRVDKETGEEEWSVFAGGPTTINRPRDVAVGSDGLLYVADTDRHRIVVLDPADGSFVRAFGSQGGGNNQFRSPRAVTSDGDGGIWVADAFNQRLKHHAADGTFLGATSGQYGTGNDQYRSPHCVFTDGAYVNVCDTFGFRIQRYSVDAGGAPVWDSVLVGQPPAQGGFNGPFATAYAPDGSLFVADWFNHRIQKFDADGDFVTEFGGYGTGANNPSLIFPRGLLVSPAGELIVTDSENNRIARFDLDGNFIASFRPLTGLALNRPHQTAMAPDGTFWIADTNRSRVVHLDIDGTVLHTWDDGGTMQSPQGIAVDGDGDVYVSTTTSNGRIFKYAPDGTRLATIATNGTADGSVARPAGLLITGSGAEAQLWVADANNGRVQVLGLDGTFQLAFGSAGSGPGQFSTPKAVAISPVDGTIAVADHVNNRVSLWSQS